MKGGLIVILTALESLYKADLLQKINLTVALMSDEESSSLADDEGISRRDLIEAAKKSEYALGFEFAVDSINKATIARRSYTGWTMEVEAKGGHSSKIFSKNLEYGANYALSHMLTKLKNSIKGKEHLTINPGLIAGGTTLNYDKDSSSAIISGKSNVIAKKSIAKGDIRALFPEHLEFAKKKFSNLIKNPLPGTKVRVSFGETYPPMSPTKGNEKLLKTLNQVSQDLGYGKVTALDPAKRGAADTSFVSPYVKNIIDGLGLLGTGAHSENEKIDLNEIPKIVSRSGILIYRLANIKN